MANQVFPKKSPFSYKIEEIREATNEVESGTLARAKDFKPKLFILENTHEPEKTELSHQNSKLTKLDVPSKSKLLELLKIKKLRLMLFSKRKVSYNQKLLIVDTICVIFAFSDVILEVSMESHLN
jgi:hypothetical protein